MADLTVDYAPAVQPRRPQRRWTNPATPHRDSRPTPRRPPPHRWRQDG
jgi:hypothetical protein